MKTRLPRVAAPNAAVLFFLAIFFQTAQAEIDPGVRIRIKFVHGQCAPGSQSIDLVNNSVHFQRITYLKRAARDERKITALQPNRSEWIGCDNNGFKYTLVETTPIQ